MRRELDLNAVSDGKLYRQSDMVKLCSHLEQNF